MTVTIHDLEEYVKVALACTSLFLYDTVNSYVD